MGKNQRECGRRAKWAKIKGSAEEGQNGQKSKGVRKKGKNQLMLKGDTNSFDFVEEKKTTQLLSLGCVLTLVGRFLSFLVSLWANR